MAQRITPKNLIIVILCKERLKYLVYTWSSLMKTLPFGYTIYVYDDGSTNEDLLEFLTTNSLFKLRQSININCSVLEKYIGHFPVLTYSKGIANQIILRHESCSVLNTEISFKMMREVFDENPDIDFILRIEDDVVFKQDWFQTLTEKWLNWSIINPGILCGCAIGHRLQQNMDIITDGHPSAQCVLIPRTFYELDKELFRGPFKFKTKADLYMDQFCRDVGLECGMLSKSVCQHIGIESEELKGHSNDYYSKTYTFDKRIDLSVEPPFIF
jgi:hypothetical protein